MQALITVGEKERGEREKAGKEATSVGRDQQSGHGSEDDSNHSDTTIYVSLCTHWLSLQDSVLGPIQSKT